MKLIEFVNGSLNGVVIPVDCEITLTGETKNLEPSMLSLPECLSPGSVLTIVYEDDKVYLVGAGKKKINLIDNIVYSFFGLCFFVFSEGERNPKYTRLYIKKYGPVSLFILMFNVLAIILSVGFFYNNASEEIKEYFNLIDEGYIKDGKLYSFDPQVIDILPSEWQDNILISEIGKHKKLTNFLIDVKTKDYKSIPFTLSDKGSYTQVIVDYSDKVLNMMALLGENGITFKYQAGSWLVNDVKKANDLLKSSSYGDETLKILQLDNGNSETISLSNFPYAVFYSTEANSYIYDSQSKYWQGSYVPGIGRIESISKNNVIFTQNKQRKIYVFSKQ